MPSHSTTCHFISSTLHRGQSTALLQMDLERIARATVRAGAALLVYNHHLPAVLGKAEGQGENWHGHVTAVTIAPAYRRQRLADKLMKLLEDVTEHMCVIEVAYCTAHLRCPHRHNGYFVDLFVRKSNSVAIGMYTRVRM